MSTSSAGSSSPSPSSSRDTSPVVEHDPLAAARLAQLEAILQHQFGVAETVNIAEDDAERPAKRVKTVHDTKEPTAEATAADRAEPELVAFRLFSTHKKPQTVLLTSADDVWPVVPDPRIRDTEDESAERRLLRRKGIEQTAVDGRDVLLSASTLPLCPLHANRVVTRRFAGFARHGSQNGPATKAKAAQKSEKTPRVKTSRKHRTVSDRFPTLAYLDSAQGIPRASGRRTRTQQDSTQQETKSAPSRPSCRKRSDRPPALIVKPVLLAPPSQEHPKPPPRAASASKKRQPAKPVAAVPPPTASDQPKGNRRLSRARRQLAKARLAKELGKNAKKNKRKKAKLKAKQAAVTA